jgi:5-methylcytosine-specific restriction protein A
MTRKHLSAKTRAAVLERHDRTCHLCGGPIQATEAWDVSHEIPLAIGGADDETNWLPAHRKCHREHTAAVDAPLIAKTRRQHLKHIGAWPKSRARIPSRPFQTTRG